MVLNYGFPTIQRTDAGRQSLNKFRKVLWKCIMDPTPRNLLIIMAKPRIAHLETVMTKLFSVAGITLTKGHNSMSC